MECSRVATSLVSAPRTRKQLNEATTIISLNTLGATAYALWSSNLQFAIFIFQFAVCGTKPALLDRDTMLLSISMQLAVNRNIWRARPTLRECAARHSSLTPP